MNSEHLKQISKEIINSGHQLRTRVGGYSMFPYLRQNDIVTIKPVLDENLRIGDILVFQQHTKLIAHRLIKKTTLIDNTYYICKGDSLMVRDYKISIRDILGKIIAFERNRRMYNLESRIRIKLHYAIARISPYSYWFYFILKQTNKIVRKLGEQIKQRK